MEIEKLKEIIKEIIKEIKKFERMVEGAKLKALAKKGLEKPLSDREFKELMRLKENYDNVLEFLKGEDDS